MNDIEAIQRHKGLYVHLVDATSRDQDVAWLDAIEALFTTDAVAEYGWATYTSARAVRNYFGRPDRRRHFAWTWHAIHSPVIEVDGDRARARWTLHAMSGRVDDPADITVTFGRYDDDYVRVGGEWKLSRLRFLNETPGARN